MEMVKETKSKTFYARVSLSDFYDIKRKAMLYSKNNMSQYLLYVCLNYEFTKIDYVQPAPAKFDKTSKVLVFKATPSHAEEIIEFARLHAKGNVAAYIRHCGYYYVPSRDELNKDILSGRNPVHKMHEGMKSHRGKFLKRKPRGLNPKVPGVGDNQTH